MKTSKLLKPLAVCMLSILTLGIGAGFGATTARAAETETMETASPVEAAQTTETEATAFITLSADIQDVPSEEQEMTAVTEDAEEEQNEEDEEKVALNDGKTLKLQVGERARISLTGAKNAKWSVSDNKSGKKNSKIVKIAKRKSKTVKVKALKKGSCYVKATVAGKTYTCKIVVKNATGAVKGTMKKTYTQEDLDLLSRLINGEAGSSWISNTEQRAVGSVVLNRMKSKRFPNTLRGVIYQRGQYACTWDGNFNKKPSKRAIANAKYLLENGSTLPSNVVFQAQFVQGRGIYTKLGNHYFCYI